MENRWKLSSFSILLLMTVAAVVGMACFSMLKVQYSPSSPQKNLTVNYSYPGASARIVEAEVTTKLEGVLSNIVGCTSVSSVSDDGGGRVTITVGKKSDIESVRFEVSSQIRNMYSSLPEGCSYPTISLNQRGEKSQTAITFTLRSSLPSKDIANFVESQLLHPLSMVDGVGAVSFYGQTPYEWVVTFDADKAASAGISAIDIRSAMTDYYADRVLGLTDMGTGSFAVRLRSGGEGSFDDIPVKNIDGRVVYLGEIASARYQEALPNQYYRINGLNILTLSVESSPDANILTLVKDVRACIDELNAIFPDEISISVSYDYSEYIADELDKIYLRTGLCLLLLLLFVFAVSRSWRYMLVISITLAMNLLVAVAFYFFLGLHIHIYTLAGITVSLGIIIDNSIVMVDHYSRFRTRSVFPAMLSSVMTTVVALLVVLLLPEQEKANLIDFTLVIIINLSVSLLVSFFFVPALLDYMPSGIRDTKRSRKVKKLRRIVRRESLYDRYLRWGTSHRWVLVVLLIAAFGIPTCMIPQGRQELPEDASRWDKAMNKVANWDFYSSNRVGIDKVLGTSFALFNKAMSHSNFYREPERQSLYVRAGMPEGCTVHQLNQVMRSMENYLADIDEIDVFETRIYSYDNGTINVMFKPEYEATYVPLMVKSDIISMATVFGGANWSVSGFDDSYFNNNIISTYRSNSINISGYNYDRLLEYGETLVGYLSKNKRVSQPGIWAGNSYDMPKTEFNISYDFDALTALGLSPYEYYSALQSPLFNSRVMSLPQDGEYVTVRLESSSRDDVDIWNVENTAVQMGEGKMKLSQVGSITKEKTGLEIHKENQSYMISVKFDFVGSYALAEKVIDEAVDHMNIDVLPIGFKASTPGRGWFYEHKDKYAGLILLVILMIFVICAIHFNSLRDPLAIIMLVPLSFVGMFLAFGIGDFTFDKGGFAAFVMLSGITVNAGIYLVSSWHHEAARYRDPYRAYIKAFKLKIRPILLTVISTVLGLIPFLFDGPSEVFWFAFAIGTIAGLVFSLIALLFYLPVFVLARRQQENSVQAK